MVGMRTMRVIAFQRDLVDRIAAENLREFGHLRDEQNEIREIGLNPCGFRMRQTCCAVRHAERKTRNAVGCDRETPAGKRKARVVRIEAVLRLRTIRSFDDEQAFAAEVEPQASMLDRPIGRNVN